MELVCRMEWDEEMVVSSFELSLSRQGRQSVVKEAS